MAWFGLLVTCTVFLFGRVECGAPYFGTEIGPLKKHAHDVEGQVFAVDDRTLYIKGFSYDGQGPDAYFWGGSSSKPDATGFIIPDEKGKKTPLKAYRKNDLLLRFPPGKTLRNTKWISVWCRKFNANFGEISIPSDLLIPHPVEVGRIPTLVHGVSSGPVMVVDTQTLLVPEFTYDGKGPAAYWWVSRGARQHPRGLRLADENGSFSPLQKYTGKTVVITLPPDHTVHDFDWFGVWSDEASVDFGSVALPQNLVVPPSPRTLGIELEYKLNCEVLRDDLGYEVRWIMDGEDIVMQLVARLERGEYMSFGLSKNDSKSEMTKADVIVAWMDKRGRGHAQDYYLASKEQCVGGRGSCPDTKFPDGRDSVTLLNAARVNGYTMITVKRPQVGMDERYDQHVYSDGPQAIVWAIGPLNEKNEVSYHGIMRSEGDVYIDFARSPQWNCPQPADHAETAPPPPTTTLAPTKKPVLTKRPSPARKPTERVRKAHSYASRDGDVRGSESKEESGWKVPPVVCPADRTLRVQIGPSGEKKGFQAITGVVSWGIAWYVNGLLVPEITLERGKSYTFIVEGGDDPENPARTHPFYITDDPVGGYEHKSATEKKKVKVFAGVSEDRRGRHTPTAKGRLCEWKLPQELSSDEFSTFDEFQENLELKCDRGKPGRFVFRPDSKTPDLLYYQCYTHRHLGWKIHIVDSCEGGLRHEASIQYVRNITYNSLARDFKRGGAEKKKLSSYEEQLYPGNDGIPLNLYADLSTPPSEKSSTIYQKPTTPTKKQYFFTTTTNAKKFTPTTRHPMTMESFHLGDVVHPYQQRGSYYSQFVPQKSLGQSSLKTNDQTKVRAYRKPTLQQRPQFGDTALTTVKETPQWWNDPSRANDRRSNGDRQQAISTLKQQLESVQQQPALRNRPLVAENPKHHNRHPQDNSRVFALASSREKSLVPLLVMAPKERQSRLRSGIKGGGGDYVASVNIPRHAPSNRSGTPLVPVVVENSPRHMHALQQVLSLLNNNPQSIQVIRVRRDADHRGGDHTHEDHDHHHEGHEMHHKDASSTKSHALSLVVPRNVLLLLCTLYIFKTLRLV